MNSEIIRSVRNYMWHRKLQEDRREEVGYGRQQ
jgi:hypothetical protein